MKRTVIYTYEQISSEIERLADKINADYSGKSLLCVCVLKGAFMFFSELVKRLSCDVEIDFVRVSSYNGDKAEKLQMLLDVKEDVIGKDVLLVEDIVDSGATVDFLRHVFSDKGARSVKVACLLNKPLGRKVNAEPDYCAFTLEGDGFVVGFGLDYDQKYRNLNHIEEVRFD